MTVARLLYTLFHTVQDFAGFCSKCKNPISGQSYSLGIDVWQDGVLTSTRVIKNHETLCFPCFDPIKASFPSKTEI